MKFWTTEIVRKQVSHSVRKHRCTQARTHTHSLSFYEHCGDNDVFKWLSLQWLVFWDLLYTPIELHPVLPTACESDFYFSLSLAVLHKISIYCFSFLFQYWSYELIRCSTVLFTGCMLIMYITEWCMHVCIWWYGAVNTLFCVEIFL